VLPHLDLAGLKVGLDVGLVGLEVGLVGLDVGLDVGLVGLDVGLVGLDVGTGVGGVGAGVGGVGAGVGLVVGAHILFTLLAPVRFHALMSVMAPIPDPRYTMTPVL
jgi:hypothetical protein